MMLAVRSYLQEAPKPAENVAAERAGARSRWSMQDVLVRIKRAVIARRYVFTEKAAVEMEASKKAM